MCPRPSGLVQKRAYRSKYLRTSNALNITVSITTESAEFVQSSLHLLRNMQAKLQEQAFKRCRLVFLPFKILLITDVFLRYEFSDLF